MAQSCPPGGENIWQVFSSLGRSGGQGFAGISQQEIAAWQYNHGVRLTSWELDTLKAIDNVAAQVAAKHKAAQK